MNTGYLVPLKDDPKPRIICGYCQEDIDMVGAWDECPAYHRESKSYHLIFLRAEAVGR